MSAAGQAAVPRRWPAALRWTGCFALVLGAHAAAAAALLGHWHAQIEPLADAPVILVDLAPAPAAPAACRRARRRPARSRRRLRAPPAPAKPAMTADVTSAIEQPDGKVETLTPPPQPQPSVRDVVLPPRKPGGKAAAHKRHRRQAHLPARPAPPRARPRAPWRRRRARAQGDPRAVPNWKSALVARLERYKRYPADAQARGMQGVAQLAFTRRPQRPCASRAHRALVGLGLLDRATLALVCRARNRCRRRRRKCAARRSRSLSQFATACAEKPRCFRRAWHWLTRVNHNVEAMALTAARSLAV